MRSVQVEELAQTVRDLRLLHHASVDHKILVPVVLGFGMGKLRRNLGALLH